MSITPYGFQVESQQFVNAPQPQPEPPEELPLEDVLRIYMHGADKALDPETELPEYAAMLLARTAGQEVDEERFNLLDKRVRAWRGARVNLRQIETISHDLARQIGLDPEKSINTVAAVLTGDREVFIDTLREISPTAAQKLDPALYTGSNTMAGLAQKVMRGGYGGVLIEAANIPLRPLKALETGQFFRQVTEEVMSNDQLRRTYAHVLPVIGQDVDDVTGYQDLIFDMTTLMHTVDPPNVLARAAAQAVPLLTDLGIFKAGSALYRATGAAKALEGARRASKLAHVVNASLDTAAQFATHATAQSAIRVAKNEISYRQAAKDVALSSVAGAIIGGKTGALGVTKAGEIVDQIIKGSKLQALALGALNAATDVAIFEGTNLAAGGQLPRLADGSLDLGALGAQFILFTALQATGNLQKHAVFKRLGTPAEIRESIRNEIMARRLYTWLMGGRPSDPKSIPEETLEGQGRLEIIRSLGYDLSDAGYLVVTNPQRASQVLKAIYDMVPAYLRELGDDPTARGLTVPEHVVERMARELGVEYRSLYTEEGRAAAVQELKQRQQAIEGARSVIELHHDMMGALGKMLRDIPNGDVLLSKFADLLALNRHKEAAAFVDDLARKASRNPEFINLMRSVVKNHRAYLQSQRLLVDNLAKARQLTDALTELIESNRLPHKVAPEVHTTLDALAERTTIEFGEIDTDLLATAHRAVDALATESRAGRIGIVPRGAELNVLRKAYKAVYDRELAGDEAAKVWTLISRAGMSLPRPLSEGTSRTEAILRDLPPYLQDLFTKSMRELERIKDRPSTVLKEQKKVESAQKQFLEELFLYMARNEAMTLVPELSGKPAMTAQQTRKFIRKRVQVMMRALDIMLHQAPSWHPARLVLDRLDNQTRRDIYRRAMNRIAKEYFDIAATVRTRIDKDFTPDRIQQISRKARLIDSFQAELKQRVETLTKTGDADPVRLPAHDQAVNALLSDFAAKVQQAEELGMGVPFEVRQSILLSILYSDKSLKPEERQRLVEYYAHVTNTPVEEVEALVKRIQETKPVIEPRRAPRDTFTAKEVSAEAFVGVGRAYRQRLQAIVDLLERREVDIQSLAEALGFSPADIETAIDFLRNLNRNVTSEADKLLKVDTLNLADAARYVLLKLVRGDTNIDLNRKLDVPDETQRAQVLAEAIQAGVMLGVANRLYGSPFTEGASKLLRLFIDRQRELWRHNKDTRPHLMAAAVVARISRIGHRLDRLARNNKALQSFIVELTRPADTRRPRRLLNLLGYSKDEIESNKQLLGLADLIYRLGDVIQQLPRDIRTFDDLVFRAHKIDPNLPTHVLAEVMLLSGVVPEGVEVIPADIFQSMVGRGLPAFLPVGRAEEVLPELYSRVAALFGQEYDKYIETSGAADRYGSLLNLDSNHADIRAIVGNATKALAETGTINSIFTTRLVSAVQRLESLAGDELKAELGRLVSIVQSTTRMAELTPETARYVMNVLAELPATNKTDIATVVRTMGALAAEHWGRQAATGNIAVDAATRSIRVALADWKRARETGDEAAARRASEILSSMMDARVVVTDQETKHLSTWQRRVVEGVREAGREGPILVTSEGVFLLQPDGRLVDARLYAPPIRTPEEAAINVTEAIQAQIERYDQIVEEALRDPAFNDVPVINEQVLQRIKQQSLGFKRRRDFAVVKNMVEDGLVSETTDPGLLVGIINTYKVDPITGRVRVVFADLTTKEFESTAEARAWFSGAEGQQRLARIRDSQSGQIRTTTLLNMAGLSVATALHFAGITNPWVLPAYGAVVGLNAVRTMLRRASLTPQQRALLEHLDIAESRLRRGDEVSKVKGMMQRLAATVSLPNFRFVRSTSGAFNEYGKQAMVQVRKAVSGWSRGMKQGITFRDPKTGQERVYRSPEGHELNFRDLSIRLRGLLGHPWSRAVLGTASRWWGVALDNNTKFAILAHYVPSRILARNDWFNWSAERLQAEIRKYYEGLRKNPFAERWYDMDQFVVPTLAELELALSGMPKDVKILARDMATYMRWLRAQEIRAARERVRSEAKPELADVRKQHDLIHDIVGPTTAAYLTNLTFDALKTSAHKATDIIREYAQARPNSELEDELNTLVLDVLADGSKQNKVEALSRDIAARFGMPYEQHATELRDLAQALVTFASATGRAPQSVILGRVPRRLFTRWLMERMQNELRTVDVVRAFETYVPEIMRKIHFEKPLREAVVLFNKAFLNDPERRAEALAYLADISRNPALLDPIARAAGGPLQRFGALLTQLGYNHILLFSPRQFLLDMSTLMTLPQGTPRPLYHHMQAMWALSDLNGTGRFFYQLMKTHDIAINALPEWETGHGLVKLFEWLYGQKDPAPDANTEQAGRFMTFVREIRTASQSAAETKGRSVLAGVTRALSKAQQLGDVVGFSEYLNHLVLWTAQIHTHTTRMLEDMGGTLVRREGKTGVLMPDGRFLDPFDVFIGSYVAAYGHVTGKERMPQTPLVDVDAVMRAATHNVDTTLGLFSAANLSPLQRALKRIPVIGHLMTAFTTFQWNMLNAYASDIYTLAFAAPGTVSARQRAEAAARLRRRFVMLNAIGGVTAWRAVLTPAMMLTKLMLTSIFDSKRLEELLPDSFDDPRFQYYLDLIDETIGIKYFTRAPAFATLWKVLGLDPGTVPDFGRRVAIEIPLLSRWRTARASDIGIPLFGPLSDFVADFVTVTAAGVGWKSKEATNEVYDAAVRLLGAPMASKVLGTPVHGPAIPLTNPGIPVSFGLLGILIEERLGADEGLPPMSASFETLRATPYTWTESIAKAFVAPIMREAYGPYGAVWFRHRNKVTKLGAQYRERLVRLTLDVLPEDPDRYFRELEELNRLAWKTVPFFTIDPKTGKKRLARPEDYSTGRFGITGVHPLLSSIDVTREVRARLRRRTMTRPERAIFKLPESVTYDEYVRAIDVLKKAGKLRIITGDGAPTPAPLAPLSTMFNDKDPDVAQAARTVWWYKIQQEQLDTDVEDLPTFTTPTN